MIIIKNCRIVKELTPGWEKEAADIIIEGKQIKGLEQNYSTVPSEATVINAQGKMLLPGFFDLHVHLDSSGGDILEDNVQSDSFRTLKAFKFAQQTLESGFTTIRDVGDRNNIIIGLRNAINDGYVAGPRILASGRIISATEAGNDFFMGMYNEADGPDATRKAAREQLKAGADFLKYMGTGAVMNPGGDPGAPLYDIDEIKAIVAEAKKHGTYVAGHCHGSEGIKNAIVAGVRTIEHGSLVDAECIDLLKNVESYLVPTMVVKKHLYEHDLGSSNFMREKIKKHLEQVKECLSNAYQAGLKMGFGTDAGTYYNYHGNNAEEFICRYEMLGMKPVDILLQATKYSAEIIGVSDSHGTVEVGKIADLLLVNGDPLQDLQVLLQGIEIVFKDGRIAKNQ